MNSGREISIDLKYEIELAKESNQKKMQNKIKELTEKLERKENECHTLELKLTTLTEDYETVASDLQLKNKILEDFEKKGKSLNDESQKFLTQIKALNEKISKLQKINLELKESVQNEKKVTAQREKEVELIRKDLYRSETELAARNKRIETLMDDVSKLKNNYKVQKSSKDVIKDGTDKRLEKAQDEIKKLEKQRNDLFTVFKKQGQLVEILKKQKLNLESAFMWNN
jgi:chromosome segregation ATPase